MSNSSPFNLTLLYNHAIVLTEDAAAFLHLGQTQNAWAKLEQRKDLLRDIQRNLGRAPLWGSIPDAEDAAIRYVLADRTLETAIKALE